jgi:hypothetical protein
MVETMYVEDHNSHRTSKIILFTNKYHILNPPQDLRYVDLTWSLF